MTRSVSVAIVGAGFGGVAATIALKRRGYEDIVVFERGDSVGGVWRANTYPGLACDVVSHLYSFSFAPNPRWSRRYSPREDIKAYLEEVARDHDVLRHVRFGQEVEGAAFDEESGRWRVTTAAGEEVEADVLVTACGQLQRAAIPDVAGLDRFAGPMFHSAHWDHSQDLTGKRVAVVGTGASAIQFIPALAKEVAELAIFQRSAPWVLPKLDVAYSERTKRLYERRPALQRAWRRAWWWALEGSVPLFSRNPPRRARVMAPLVTGLSNLHRLVQLRFDRRLAAATRPDYPIGCKRILITSDWYPALRRPNVSLVTERISEVTGDAIVTADGARHAADAIVFGTGFTATEFLAPMEVRGRGGRRLADVWTKGAEAYYGLAVPDFPNLFLLYGPNTNHGTGSAIELLEKQAEYVAQAVGHLAAGAAERLEVRREVHDRFQRWLDERLPATVWASCSSWYTTAEGRVTNNWPGSFQEYFDFIDELSLDDYVTDAPRPEPAATPPA